jgi:hypothetical protein
VSAELLREAAAKLRETATKATSGPWTTSGADTVGQWSVYDAEWQVASARAYNHTRSIGGRRGPGYIDPDANAAWIALASPLLAEPLAVVLEALAATIDEEGACWTGVYGDDELISIAKFILGDNAAAGEG